MKKILIYLVICTIALMSCAACVDPEESANPSVSLSETTSTTITSGISKSEVTTPNIKTSSDAETSTSILATVQTDIAGTFGLNQTPEQFLEALKDEGLKLSTEYSKDGKNVNPDGTFSYYTDDIRIFYSEERTPYQVTVISSKFSTDKGVQVGDPLSKVLELYGNKYILDDYKRWYHYKQDDDYLAFMIDNEAVVWWALMKNPITTN